MIEITAKSNKKLTVMQLLKLVYIAHGWMLGLYGRPLICDRIEAWKYGPVIPELYHQIKDCRGGTVSNIECATGADLDIQELDLLEQVIGKYGNFSGPQLSNLTHQSGTPWNERFNSYDFNIQIEDDLIKAHFEKMAA